MIALYRSYLKAGIIGGPRAPSRTVPSILLRLVAKNADQEVYRHQQHVPSSRTVRNQKRIPARNRAVVDPHPLPNPHSQNRHPAR
jgi:hypothetical protein